MSPRLISVPVPSMAILTPPQKKYVSLSRTKESSAKAPVGPDLSRFTNPTLSICAFQRSDIRRSASSLSAIPPSVVSMAPVSRTDVSSASFNASRAPRLEAERRISERWKAHIQRVGNPLPCS